MKFSRETRQETIEKLKNEELDLLIVGGGITGAGVAIQAAASGMKTGLIEMQDFAEGTSSRSTKLVHGGIRYLKTFDVGVVSDTVKERAVVQGIAPHIPKPFPMLLPIYDEPDSTFDMFSVKVAMDLYDQLAGVTGTQYANYVIDKKEVLQREPELKSENLLGAGVYLDYVNNDARLVIENIKEAAELGGLLASHVEAIGVEHDNDKITGIKVRDNLSGTEFVIHAKLFINTTGPWVEKFLSLDDKDGEGLKLRPTKGVHLVIDESKLKVPQPTYFDSGIQDGRMIFVVPREGKTYFGTTDTDFNGDFKHPRVEQEDVDYLLNILNNRYPNANIKQQDIEASWVGLRPLIASNSGSDYNGGGAGAGKVSDASFANLINIVEKYEAKEATRDDVERAISRLKTARAEKKVTASQVSRGSELKIGDDGLITLAGGKITDYRKMAAGALALLRREFKEQFGDTFAEIDSTKLQVSGGHFDPSNVAATLDFYTKIGLDKGLSEADARELANRFGSNTGRVISYISGISAAPGLSLAETASLHYSVNEEMTLTPVYYLLRRTNHLLFHADKLAAIVQPVVDEMAKLLGWSAEQKNEELNKVQAAIAESRLEHLA